MQQEMDPPLARPPELGPGSAASGMHRLGGAAPKVQRVRGAQPLGMQSFGGAALKVCGVRGGSPPRMRGVREATPPGTYIYIRIY